MNPVSGDIDGTRPRSARRSKKPSDQGADLWSPEMVLVTVSAISWKTPIFSPPTTARCSASQADEASPAVIGFIDYNLHEQNDNGTVRKYNAAAVVREPHSSARGSRCFPTIATSTTSGFHTWRIARTGRCRDAARTSQRRGLDLRGHVGRVLRRRAAARAERQGSHGPPEPERITRYRASGTSVTR